MDVWQLIAERKIEEAMAEGVFDNLPGAGRPMPLDDDPFEDPSLRMAHRLLKNHGIAPAWIEESKEIESAVEALRAEWRRYRDPERIRQRARELNYRIASFNLKTPAGLCQKLPLDLERETARGDLQ